MELEVYEMKRQQLETVLRQLGEIGQNLGLEGQKKESDNAIELLQQEQFNMAVVGEFSRGKSTFVNALLGKNILPASKSPTTAVISKITYGDPPEFILHYKNGLGSKQVSQEEFSGLKAPKEGLLNNIKDKIQKSINIGEQEKLDSIEYVSIKYPLAFCKDRVELVDTPGTNDLNTGRIEITYRYLEQADALIMLLAADQALSESEAKFLQERILKKKIQDIFFIINRKDALHGPDEEQKVLDFVQTNLKALLPEDMRTNLKVFLVSSRQALLYRRAEGGEQLKPKLLAEKPDNFEITGFVEFEKELGWFLSEEKGKAKLEKYIRKGQEIITELNKTIVLRQDMFSHSVDEIREKAAAMEPEFLEAKHKSKKIIGNLRSRLESTESQLENSCIIAGERLRQVANEAVDNYSGDMDAKNIKIAVERAVTPEQKRWIEEMRQSQNKLLQEETNKAEQALQRIWKDVNSTCCLDTHMLDKSATVMSFDIQGVKKENISDTQADIGGWCVGGAIGLLVSAHLLPALALGALGAGLLGLFSDSDDDIREKVKAQISEQYTEQAESIKSDIIDGYRNQVKDICVQLQEAIDSRISDMHNQLQIVLREKESQEKDVDQRIKELSTKVHALEDCGRTLIALAK
ncbi:MAG: dynamin family protein [Anaerovibrio sp.]|uniref:dynamin family protein n=1 Tax=Anaerovibrio sp. TaxID=1872532 RepID=UPI0025D99BF0|nr:dynamin family protein [Anaerovibrio sp.]MCR5175245.1 dynamin family protein [Anaerovibrio sp.]